MAWKAHETVQRPDGSTHLIRRRKDVGPRGEQSFVVRIVGPDGLTREIWHEVMDHTGKVMHRHATFQRPDTDA